MIRIIENKACYIRFLCRKIFIDEIVEVITGINIVIHVPIYLVCNSIC